MKINEKLILWLNTGDALQLDAGSFTSRHRSPIIILESILKTDSRPDDSNGRL
jgi:hypothetical protein